MAMDFDFHDPKNQKLIIMYIIPVVGLAAFFNFMIKPMMSEVSEKQSQITTFNNQINSTMRALATTDDLEKRHIELNAKLEELQALLPEEENVADLLDQFSIVERDSKVYVVGFDAMSVIAGAGKPYRANNYEVTLDAGYHQFAMFMCGIMALPRLFSFSELRIELNQDMQDEEAHEGLEDQPRNLRIECTLTSYVFDKSTGGDDDS